MKGTVGRGGVAIDSFVRVVSAIEKIHKHLSGFLQPFPSHLSFFFASKHVFFFCTFQYPMCICSVISFCHLAVLSANGVFTVYSGFATRMLCPVCFSHCASDNDTTFGMFFRDPNERLVVTCADMRSVCFCNLFLFFCSCLS
jgi:hypothetical protein